MNHSHMPVRHFIAQLDRWKEERRQRNLRPEWLNELIDQLADLFEPFHDVARVGFECHPHESGWEVGLFLGRTEIVGGPEDGRAEPCNFTYDLKTLKGYFESVEEFQLHALPGKSEDAELEPCSFLTVSGTMHEQNVTVRIYSVPPEEAGVGLRRYIDGRCETV